MCVFKRFIICNIFRNLIKLIDFMEEVKGRMAKIVCEYHATETELQIQSTRFQFTLDIEIVI